MTYTRDEMEAKAATCESLGYRVPAAMIRQLLAENADRDATIARLQARLDAGPSVSDMAVCKGLALSLKATNVADSIQNIIERMEAANGK